MFSQVLLKVHCTQPPLLIPARGRAAGGGGAGLNIPDALAPLEAAPTEDILGFSPEQFAALAGGMGAALSPPDTWGERLGTFAARLGQGKIFEKAPVVDRTLEKSTLGKGKKKPTDNISSALDNEI